MSCYGSGLNGYDVAETVSQHPLIELYGYQRPVQFTASYGHRAARPPITKLLPRQQDIVFCF